MSSSESAHDSLIALSGVADTDSAYVLRLPTAKFLAKTWHIIMEANLAISRSSMVGS
jgi:hypothetical protein